MNTSSPPSTGLPVDTPMSVSVIDDALVVRVRGPFDDDAAAMLLEVFDAAVEATDDTQRIEIDLREVESFSGSARGVLMACARLGAQVRGGVRFRMGRSETR
jgi:anti-anti-sigma regulatory factor